MAKNFVQDGLTIEFTAAAAVASGDVVVIGSLIGVALDAVANGEIGVASIEGVFELPKTTGTANTVGELIDFDITAAEISKLAVPAAGDIVGCGVAFAAAASGDTTILVKINEGSSTISAGP